MEQNIELTIEKAMHRHANTLRLEGMGLNILEINNNGSRQFYEYFGSNNNYKILSTDDELKSFLHKSSVSKKSFDCIINNMVLQEIWDNQAFLKTCFMMLKPGKFIIVNCPWEWPRQGESDYWRISPIALAKLLSNAGFDHGNVSLWDDILTSGMARRPK